MKTALLALALCAGTARADDPVAPQVFADMGLTVQAPALEGLRFQAGDKTGQVRGTWQGKIGTVQVDAVLLLLPNTEFGFGEATDVVSLALDNLRDPEGRGETTFQWETKRLLPGAFGFAPYAQLASGPIRKDTKVVGTRYVLGGLLKDSGYAIEAVAVPAPGGTQSKLILDWLEKGITYAGPARNAKWDDAEAKKRWERFSPPKAIKKFDPVIRTAHYIIMCDTGAANTNKKFGEQMEVCYAAIKKMYPFDEVAGQSLMPVFLFANKEEYSEFYAKIAGISIEEANKSKGHAWKDYYATYFDAKNDPVHIHEATHQIFANRLALEGGGSWFQEGVAEYISSNKNDRNIEASKVKKGRHKPLVDMMKTESLLYSAKEDVSGEDQAESGYLQAALFIEFLRESKWAAPKFQEFIHAVGMTPANDVVAIERAIKLVYGVDLKTLEEKWVEYCKKR
jgi:hypothetical protein